jgi:hypothetical protein
MQNKFTFYADLSLLNIVYHAFLLPIEAIKNKLRSNIGQTLSQSLVYQKWSSGNHFRETTNNQEGFKLVKFMFGKGQLFKYKILLSLFFLPKTQKQKGFFSIKQISNQFSLPFRLIQYKTWTQIKQFTLSSKHESFAENPANKYCCSLKNKQNHDSWSSSSSCEKKRKRKKVFATFHPKLLSASTSNVTDCIVAKIEMTDLRKKSFSFVADVLCTDNAIVRKIMRH